MNRAPTLASLGEHQTPVRRNPRLAGYDYSKSGAYFVTICTDGRRCLFGDIVGESMVRTELGRLVAEIWDQIPVAHPGVQVDTFVVMPNHVHGILVLISEESRGAGAMNRAPTADLGGIVRAWKARVTRAGRVGSQISGQLWQRGYHEHIVRDEPDLHRIRRYIEENPMSWAIDHENPFRSKAP